jgi:hypothetical protein
MHRHLIALAVDLFLAWPSLLIQWVQDQPTLVFGAQKRSSAEHPIKDREENHEYDRENPS